jgi:ribosomal protein L11 methyltransferase
LRFLARLLRPGSLAAPTIASALDLGSGTGVLSLAAARLGVGRVLGVDHSHLAVRCANRNAAINGLGSKVRFERGLAQDYAKAPGELAMANVPMFVQRDLIDLGAFAGRDYLVFSGLLASEENAFLGALADSLGGGLKIVDSDRDDRWVTGLVDLRGAVRKALRP